MDKYDFMEALEQKPELKQTSPVKETRQETSSPYFDIKNISAEFDKADNVGKIEIIKAIPIEPELSTEEKVEYLSICQQAEEFLLHFLQETRKRYLLLRDVFKERAFYPKSEYNNAQEEIMGDYFHLQVTDLSPILKILSKNGSPKSIDIVRELIEIDGEYLFYLNFAPILKIDQKYSSEKIIPLLEDLDPRRNALNDWQFPQLLLALSDTLGVEKLRDSLNTLIEKKNKEDLSDTFEYACSLITPSSDKTAITNLQKFYQENIKFEEYEVNKKMNEKEVSLLKSLMRKDQKILEMGCGTGRLICEMHKAGYDISGFDFTERHVDIVKKDNPDLEVFQANWHDVKFPDGTQFPGNSQDVVYSLGRNITHDYSFIDQVATFRETNRLLKPGGKFIFDIANRDKGSYKKMVEGYAEEMKKRGIKNFRHGSVYDSPDGEHFATRYAYSHEDIAMLAQLTGFEIKLVKSEILETGEGDENLYYVLEKK